MRTSAGAQEASPYAGSCSDSSEPPPALRRPGASDWARGERCDRDHRPERAWCLPRKTDESRWRCVCGRRPGELRGRAGRARCSGTGAMPRAAGPAARQLRTQASSTDVHHGRKAHTPRRGARRGASRRKSACWRHVLRADGRRRSLSRRINSSRASATPAPLRSPRTLRTRRSDCHAQIQIDVAKPRSQPNTRASSAPLTPREAGRRRSIRLHARARRRSGDPRVDV